MLGGSTRRILSSVLRRPECPSQRSLWTASEARRIDELSQGLHDDITRLRRSVYATTALGLLGAGCFAWWTLHLQQSQTAELTAAEPTAEATESSPALQPGKK